MKKNRKTSPTSPSISPEEAVRFLEDMRLLASEIDEPTVAISLRVPGNILRAIRAKAKADGKKYQSLMVAYLRKGLRAELKA
jgi:hypothetical protein